MHKKLIQIFIQYFDNKTKLLNIFLINVGLVLFFCAEKMAQNIREEITRLHRSKQLIFNSGGAIERMQDSDHSGSEMGPDSPRRPDTPPRLLRNVEKGLFSFKEVSNFGMDVVINSCKRRHTKTLPRSRRRTEKIVPTRYLSLKRRPPSI